MDLALNANGSDLDLSTGLRFVDGDDAIGQHLKIRLRFFLAEWFLDLRLGVPYYRDVLIKNPNLVAVRGIFREVVLETPGIADVESLSTSFDPATRRLSVSLVALLDSGVRLEFTDALPLDGRITV